ncbi:MAG: hypothetical protein CMM45_12515 [Rhodospirillaceae bacterium]|nr:hypothetical protein [Rhodospirillaceae bacterium]
MLDEKINEEMLAYQTGSGSEINKRPAAIKSSLTLGGLDQIKSPHIDLVIWHRTLPDHFHNWLECLLASNLPQIRILVAPDAVSSALDPMLDACGLPISAMRDFLVNDISELVHAFSIITESELVDVRLEHIDHDSCWRFHTDVVDLRLLTTYLGPGTEWVSPVHAENAIIDQKKYSGPLEQLKLAEVAVFKGKKASKTNGIVHRSPPIEDSGASRLLLCLNKRSEVSPPAWKADQ